MISINKESGFAHVIPIVVAVLAVVAIGVFTVWRSSASTCAGSMYARGSGGNCVRYIQQLVNYQLPAQTAVDGSFGPDTQARVKQVQRENPGAISADGVVGRNTWFKLCHPYVHNSASKTTAATFRSVYVAAGCDVTKK